MNSKLPKSHILLHKKRANRRTFLEGTLLTAACIALSRLISCSIFSLIANFTALWQISVKSAPENPLVTFAM